MVLGFMGLGFRVFRAHGFRVSDLRRRDTRFGSRSRALDFGCCIGIPQAKLFEDEPFTIARTASDN